MPVSYCLQKVPQPEIYLCRLVLHGVTRCQTVRCVSSSDQWPEKEPSAVHLLAYLKTALDAHLLLQTTNTKTPCLNGEDVIEQAIFPNNATSHLNKVKCSKPCLATRWYKYEYWFCRRMGAYCSICWFVHAIHPWAVIFSRISLFKIPDMKGKTLGIHQVPYQQKKRDKTKKCITWLSKARPAYSGKYNVHEWITQTEKYHH